MKISKGEFDVQVQCAISPDPPRNSGFRHFPLLFLYKVHLMQFTMFSCILHHHFNCWLPYSWVSQNNVLGQYSEVSVSCRCPKWRFHYPRLHQAPYNFIPNHPVSPSQFDSMNNAEIGWKFQSLPPSIESLLRLIALVSPPVYFVPLHPICRRYRSTLGRNGSASPLRRPSIFLLKHCLRGFVYLRSSLGPIHFYI